MALEWWRVCKEARLRRGYSQETLAGHLGWSRYKVNRIERGVSPISVGDMGAVLELCGMTWKEALDQTPDVESEVYEAAAYKHEDALRRLTATLPTMATTDLQALLAISNLMVGRVPREGRQRASRLRL